MAAALLRLLRRRPPATHPCMTTPGQGDPAPEKSVIPWDAIAADPEFKKLLSSKIRFITPLAIFFLLYYFALPVLVGWFPVLMKTKIGSVNYAYLFALSQFFMAWLVAGIYVAKASGWDKAAAAIVDKFNKR